VQSRVVRLVVLQLQTWVVVHINRQGPAVTNQGVSG
jgi:hypothetical protein